MLRIAALNDSSLEDDLLDNGPSSEVLEADAKKTHQEAVRYLASNNLDKAKDAFTKLLDNPYVSEAVNKGKFTSYFDLPQEIQYKYSCHKNLGNISMRKKDYKSACVYFYEALQLDHTEVLLWHRLGLSAIKVPDFQMALMAFTEGLEINPTHFPCTDQLLSVLFILQLYDDCLGLCIATLQKNPHYVKALAFKDEIFKRFPHRIAFAKEYYTNSESLFVDTPYDVEKGKALVETCVKLAPEPRVPPPKAEVAPVTLSGDLETLSWDNLTTLLKNTYDELVDTDATGIITKVDLKTLVSSHLLKRYAVPDTIQSKDEFAQLPSGGKKLARSLSWEEQPSPADKALSLTKITARRQTIELGGNECSHQLQVRCALFKSPLKRPIDDHCKLDVIKEESSIDTKDNKIEPKVKRQKTDEMPTHSDLTKDVVKEITDKDHPELEDQIWNKDEENSKDFHKAVEEDFTSSGETSRDDQNRKGTSTNSLVDRDNSSGSEKNAEEPCVDSNNETQAEVQLQEMMNFNDVSELMQGPHFRADYNEYSNEAELDEDPLESDDDHKETTKVETDENVSEETEKENSASNQEMPSDLNETADKCGEKSATTAEFSEVKTQRDTEKMDVDLLIVATADIDGETEKNNTLIIKEPTESHPPTEPLVGNKVTIQESESKHPKLDQQQDILLTDHEQLQKRSLDPTDESDQTGLDSSAKKPKRMKRGLERELEQLDYWGRRKAREAKRRRRTLTSKLVGAFEENEYLSWAHLLRSFIPAALLCTDVRPSTPLEGNIDPAKLCNMLKSPTRNQALLTSPNKSRDPTTVSRDAKSTPPKDSPKPGPAEIYADVFNHLNQYVPNTIEPSDLSSEELQICDFMMKRESNAGVLDLACQTHRKLLALHDKCWPTKIARCHNELYLRTRNHIAMGCPVTADEDLERLNTTGLSALVYLELSVSLFLSSNKASDRTGMPVFPFLDYPHLADDLFHLSLLNDRVDVWREGYLQALLRYHWVKAQIKLIQGFTNEGALMLEMLLTEMRWAKRDDHDIVTIKRCYVEEDNIVITQAEVQSQLNVLQRTQKLAEIEDKFNQECYEDVIEILTSIFDKTAPKTTGSTKNAPPRHTQLMLLIRSFKKMADNKGLIEWGTLCLCEAFEQYEKADADNTWQNTVSEILDELNDAYDTSNDSLAPIDEQRLSKLVSSLIAILVIQLEQGTEGSRPVFYTLSPWILLHRILSHQEQKQQHDTDTKDSSTEDICVQPYPSTLFIITAHEELGKSGWCCLENGRLLLHLLDVLLSELSRPLPEDQSTRITQSVEQVTFCLYAHPSRRAKHKHIRDHGVHQIVLKWESAVQLFKFYCPIVLPDFQTSQIASISDDVATLFKRILSLLPSSFDADNRETSVESVLKEDSKVCTQPDWTPLPPELNDCHYLLADYHFKNKEWNLAIHFYQLDVSIRADRFLSWAPLALAKKAQLETLLNSCDVIEDVKKFFVNAQMASKCFENALELDQYHCTLWVEMGGLVYMTHSQASRLLKQDLDPDMSIEEFEKLEKSKKKTLEVAEKCFRSSLEIVEKGWDDESLPDERWLYQYMLGKIAEKKCLPPQRVLHLYQEAAKSLHELGAKYPIKITYSNPQENSIESLELYYRIMTYILKYATHREHTTMDPEIVDYFYLVLNESGRSPFALGEEKSSKGLVDQPANVTKKRNLENKLEPSNKTPKSTDDSSLFMRNLVSSIVEIAMDQAEKKNIPQASCPPPNKVEKNASGLIQLCLRGLNLCISRFPHHYKSHYRIANYYHTSKSSKDNKISRAYLMGSTEQKGLFSERKIGMQNLKHCNLFAGIWRIPQDEIDRPGSFAAHMHRCVSLTLETLHELTQCAPIFEIACSLKISPEKEKKYLRDNERELLLQHATQLGLQTVKDMYKHLFKASSPVSSSKQRDFLLDVHRIYKYMGKHLPGAEASLSRVLVEGYTCMNNIPLDSGRNILKEAEMFCAQFNATIRPSSKQGNVVGLLPNTPGSGRRGRPPGPGKVKVPQKAKPKPLRLSAHAQSIQEAYRVYESLVQAQAILQTKELDALTQSKYILQYDKSKQEMLRSLQNPSVSQYFQSSLQSMKTGKSKVPPPITPPKNNPSVSGASVEPTTTQLPLRAHAHGVSITSVPKRIDSQPPKVAQPSMSITLTTKPHTKDAEPRTSTKLKVPRYLATESGSVMRIPAGISISKPVTVAAVPTKTSSVLIHPVSVESTLTLTTKHSNVSSSYSKTIDKDLSLPQVSCFIKKNDGHLGASQTLPLNLSTSVAVTPDKPKNTKPKSPEEIIILD